MDMQLLLVLLCLQYCQGDSKTCYVDPTPNRVENAALNKPATQISTHAIGTASKAVDGDTNPRYSDGSCTHTRWETGLPLYQWWMVDLEREYRIDSVNITNRFNSAERQRDFDIFVSLNSTFEDDDHMTDESLCIHVSGEMGKGETRTFTCQTPLFGQFVQIYMETLDQRDMNVCEVTVKGYPAVCFENTTTSTRPQTTTYMTTEAVKTTQKTIPATSTTSEPTEDTTTLKTTTTLETTTDATLPNPTSSTSTLLKTVVTTTTVTTTTSMTTSAALLLPDNNTTTATPTCPCVCGVSSNTTNLTQEALVELVKELAKELTVNKKETRLSKRKLISVGDGRQSAETIGFIGVLALCVPVLLIVSFDLINLWSFAKRKMNRVIIKQ